MPPSAPSGWPLGDSPAAPSHRGQRGWVPKTQKFRSQAKVAHGAGHAGNGPATPERPGVGPDRSQGGSPPAQ
eukprot:8434404-Lingulodinium_polyedra.AAC.1